MKNNHFPKLSILVIALGFGHSALALECQPNKTNYFSNQNNITLENCNLVFDDEANSKSGGYSNALNITNSSNFTISNSNISIKSGKDKILTLAVVDNSSVIIKNSQINYSGDATIVNSIGTSNITLENIHAENNNILSEILSAHAANTNANASFTLNNSTLSGGQGIGTWWSAKKDEKEELNINVTLNNTSFNSNLLVDNADFDDEFYLVNNISIVATNSSISGVVSADENKNKRSQTTANLILTNSDWSMSPFIYNNELFSNYVSNLSLDNSTVTLNKSDTFQTLKVGNLTGNGTFVLNTDLANEKSDQIVVNGKAEGSHKLDVKDSGNEPKAPNGKVTLVKTQAGEAKFSLLNRDYVDAGAYRYRLNQQGSDWVLSNNANEQSTKPVQPVTPTETTKPTDTTTTTPVAPVAPQPTTPTQPDDHPAVQKMLSETSNTLVSLRQAQLQLTELELNGIHQRLGELKTAEASNVWVRNHNARQERKAQSVAADSLSSGFKQDTTLLQIGADTAISDNWRAGGFVGTSRSDIDFNGDYGKGKLKGVHLGLYATFQTQNGIYADNIVKFDRLRTSGDGVANQSYNGYTLSSEIGKAFAFGEGWTVTPQAQLAWTHLSSGDNVESLSALTSRAGVRISKAITLANGNITPFIEVNGIHTHNRHSQVRVNQYTFDVKGAGSRIETAAGVSANFTNHRLGVQLSTAHGSHLKQPLAVQVNYRYSW